MNKLAGHVLKTFLLAILGFFTLTFAGTFTPAPATPNAGPYTLADIYNQISSSTYAYSAHSFAPAGSPDSNGTFLTLSQIWNSIQWKTLNNSGTLDAGLYATSSLADAEPNLVAGNIATGTTIFGITGRCTPAPKAPEEIATVNLNSVFPPISTGVCVISSRSTTIGPYAFDVILKAKTDVSADDYLTINGVIVVPNSLYGYCGNNRIVSAAALAGTDLLSVPANTSIVISDVDTIGVGASGNGIISVMRVY